MNLPRDPLEDKRIDECPARTRTQTCIALNVILGFPYQLDLSNCDICMGKGGLFSREGEHWRTEKAASVLDVYRDPKTWPKLRREVLVPLTIHHKIVPREALDGEGETSLALKRDSAWEQVRPSWEKAEEWVAHASSFSKAAFSRGLFSKKCSPEDRNLRNIACFGLDLSGKRVKPACPWLAKSQSGHHLCSACGCGDRKVARLDNGPNDPSDAYVKLDYPYLECPRRLPGFTNASG